jgi:hypothetical protein
MLVPPTEPSSLKVFWQNFLKVINYHVSFGTPSAPENIDGSPLTATFTVSANTNQTFAHQLGRVPNGYIPTGKSAAGDVYDGTIAWTDEEITLKCTTTGAAIQLFLW